MTRRPIILIINKYFYKICFITILFLISILIINKNSFYNSKSTATKRYHFLHFGTIIQLTISPDDPILNKQDITKIDRLLAKLHDKWHPWRDGKLMQLNKQLASLRPFETSTEIVKIIKHCKYLYNISNGYFNPAIGKLVAYWGFHQDNLGNKPINSSSINYHDMIKNIPNPNHILIKNNIINNTNPYLQLDLSGFIKADAVLQIKQILLNNNIHNALINLGGDIYIMGQKSNSNPWLIAINNNYSNKQIKLKLYNNEAIATSGTNARSYKENNKLRHHIINPENGQPAAGFDTVTVIHKDPYLTDAAATALLIAGEKEYKSVAKNMGIDKYILSKGNKHIISDKIKSRLI